MTNVRCATHELRAAGFTVIEAADGEEGLRLALAGGIDLVVTDIQMPRVTGLELIRDLKTAEPALPVIAMTGNYTTYENAARVAGAVQVVAKPSGLAGLEGAVHKALQQRRPATVL